MSELATRVPTLDALTEQLESTVYLADRGLVTALFCALRLPQPLLLEGEAGVGKTEATKTLAAVLETPLIRLQCYEGIDAAEALYEWNYQRQLLGIRLAEASARELIEHDLFGEDYLVGRPLLDAIRHPGPRPAALKAFNDGYGRRGMARGAVVLIVSDGWEHGDPALLGEQMARLSRLAYRIVWVNPRRASPRFQPLVGGMAAALPHVDTFVNGHSVEALDEVLAAIAA